MRYLFLLILLSFTLPVLAAQQETVIAGRRVVYWPPEQTSITKAPIIIFSHGFTGCAEQSTFLTSALAAHGYWVFAPDHKDASCRLLDIGRSKAMVDFNTPEAWQASTYVDRRNDIRAILAAIKKDPRFKDKIDFTQLGLAGHSLGGYTVLGLAGGWPEWQMPGIKAVLALSPYATPYWKRGNLKRLTAPVMYQGGTRDSDLTPYLMRKDGVYDQSPTPKYLVNFEGAGHFGWTDINGAQHDLMNQYALAFFDRYVRGMPDDAILTTPVKGISALRFDNKTGTATIDDLPQTTVQSQTQR